jgi:hypothetical protein
MWLPLAPSCSLNLTLDGNNCIWCAHLWLVFQCWNHVWDSVETDQEVILTYICKCEIINFNMDLEFTTPAPPILLPPSPILLFHDYPVLGPSLHFPSTYFCVQCQSFLSYWPKQFAGHHVCPCLLASLLILVLLFLPQILLQWSVLFSLYCVMNYNFKIIHMWETLLVNCIIN